MLMLHFKIWGPLSQIFLFRKYKLNAVSINILIFLMEKNVTEFAEPIVRLQDPLNSSLLLWTNQKFTPQLYTLGTIEQEKLFWNFHLSANWTRDTYIKSWKINSNVINVIPDMYVSLIWIYLLLKLLVQFKKGTISK